MAPLTDPLKLTVHFAERERTGGRFLADVLLDRLADRRIAASVMLRGISSFGPRNIIRSDESLSLSEDLPAVVSAVDSAAAIMALAGEVAAVTRRGLITLERARSVAGSMTDLDDAVTLTVFLGRRQRVGRRPGYQAVCEIIHRSGFAGATALLGVDGTMGGQRRRAQFLSRNVDVPMTVSAVGTLEQASACRAEIADAVGDPLMTVERAQLCKLDGRALERPRALAGTDEHGSPRFQKLTVITSEDSLFRGAAIHRALMRRLRESGSVSGATSLRGLWGFHGDHPPHGDRMLRLRRHVPVVTTIVGTPESIARSFAIVDELTDEHGLVLCETVAALLAIDGEDRHGDLRLPEP